MTDSIHCPDCGHENPAGAKFCVHCNHPLTEDHHHRPDAPAKESARPAGVQPPDDTPVVMRRTIRPRRPRPAESQQALQLWLIFGTVAVAIVLYVAIQATVQKSTPQVEGSSSEQQQRANLLFGELARDSNSVTTHHALADVLYDTGNWSEAIVHYRAAIRRDSSLVNALVDLGVCYFNLGDGVEAQRYFELALVRAPAQPVALFNLGIVFESRGENERALDFYHRAMQANPPAEMRAPLTQRIDALAKKLESAPRRPGRK